MSIDRLHSPWSLYLMMYIWKFVSARLSAKKSCKSTSDPTYPRIDRCVTMEVDSDLWAIAHWLLRIDPAIAIKLQGSIRDQKFLALPFSPHIKRSLLVLLVLHTWYLVSNSRYTVSVLFDLCRSENNPNVCSSSRRLQIQLRKEGLCYTNFLTRPGCSSSCIR